MGYKISCELGLGTSIINFVPYGTIGWVKDVNNLVHQCKCVGGKWESDQYGNLTPRYEWRVAGVKGTKFGSATKMDEFGNIWPTEKQAQFGSRDGYMGENIHVPLRKADIRGLLTNKYNLSKECFGVGGTWYNVISLNTFTHMRDNTIGLILTDFEISINSERGIVVSVPLLEHGVDGKAKRYPTLASAQAAMKLQKAFTFEDEEEETEVRVTTKKVKVTIEIEETKIEEIKKLGTIVR